MSEKASDLAVDVPRTIVGVEAVRGEREYRWQEALAEHNKLGPQIDVSWFLKVRCVEA